MARTIGLVGIGTALLISASATYADTPQFIPLGLLPGTDPPAETRAGGISGDGSTVVGTAGWFPSFRAFRWNSETGMTELVQLSEDLPWTSARRVSSDGSIVVGYSDNGSGLTLATMWNADGEATALGVLPGGDNSDAWGVSGDGSVAVGWSINHEGMMKAFRWTAGVGMSLMSENLVGARGISADGTTVVGSMQFGLPFRWTVKEGEVNLGLFEGTLPIPNAVSADGLTIVGQRNSPTNQALRWTEDEGWVSLGSLDGSTGSFAWDVSADGSVIVGGSFGPDTAFIWTAAQGMRDLKQALIERGAIGLEGWQLLQCRGVSDDGRTFAGYGLNPDGLIEAWWAHLPPKTGDLNGDGVVDGADLLILLSQWGNCNDPDDCPADLNDDGVVDGADLLLLLANWG